ncbi:MAG: NADH dehydrogenase ubiquinone Fe-S protein 4, partial [Alphaproteobacteria bacterium]
MDVRIYRPAKSPMQSGTANAKRWVMEFEPTA